MVNNKFHKLKNNNSDFPLLNNVDVYKFDNEFNYLRYDAVQMSLQLCTVPWDVGEAHVGQRTISGIGNVVYFETKEERNKWFDAIPDSECYRWETKFKELHRDNIIDVPVPYDVCAKFNYLRVKYNLFANDDSPINYETNDGLKEWFWFVREVEFVAPNTTRLHLLDDAFQTWIYDVTVSGMILERGHAPMFETRANKYLENPIENNINLLSEDVNFGEIDNLKHTDALVLNEKNMYACIATTGYPRIDWGTKTAETWHTSAANQNTTDGVPSVFVFAISANYLAHFLASIDVLIPQFKQTMQGVFFISGDLLTLEREFTFAEVTCYEISKNNKIFELTKLNKNQFGYDAKYSDIAKLYTSPYAHLEITDEKGNVNIVKIENTNGQIDANIALSIAYPFINIEAHILGIGGNAINNITFRNVNANTFTFSGLWYETLHQWKIPTFAVILDAAIEYDYSTYFDRKQAEMAYTNAYNNALNSATTSRSNAKNTANVNNTNAKNTANVNNTNEKNLANAEKTNADNLASITKTNSDSLVNTAKAVSDNDATTAQRVTNANAATRRTTELNIADSFINNSTLLVTHANQQYEVGRDFLNQQRTVNLNAMNDRVNSERTYATDVYNAQVDQVVASALANTVMGAASGAVAGFVSGTMASGGNPIVGAAAAIPGAVVNGISAQWQANISISNNYDLYIASWNKLSRENSIDFNVYNSSVNQQLDANLRQKDVAASLTRGTATLQRTLSNTNTGVTYDNEVSNATRIYNNSTSNNALNQNTGLTINSNLYTTTATNNANLYNARITNANNTLNMLNDNADNTLNMLNDNADNTYNTDVAIANRNRQTAQSAIENSIAQAALRSPFIYGAFADGDTATTKPIALFSNVVTQSKSAISRAGDEFLRYGYMLNKQWEFSGNWNVGKYFTYWKLSDFWVTNLNVPDLYMDKLRFFLFGGVTIWRKPEYIGKVTIYENFN